MRLWSLHPKYLDSKGMVALWRESLLAKKVLSGNTKGYKNHPQLKRFKDSSDPLAAINYYLSVLHTEAHTRGYNFDIGKISDYNNTPLINVTSGQLNFETEHLFNKLQIRDPLKYSVVKKTKRFLQHPLFNVVEGAIEPWEIVVDRKTVII